MVRCSDEARDFLVVGFLIGAGEILGESRAAQNSGARQRCKQMFGRRPPATGSVRLDLNRE
jgi:hypothetical protein